jgi:hypothetical protein
MVGIWVQLLRLSLGWCKVAKFEVGDPVMINPDAFESKEKFKQIVSPDRDDILKLWPPQSYIGTVVDYMGPNEDALVVQWDIIGPIGFLFYPGELRSAS